MALATQDIVEITQLYAVYNHAVDDGDGEAFAACFVADGALVPGPAPIAGAAALAAFARSVPEALPGIRHLASNVVVSGEGDEATGTCYLTVLLAGAEPRFFSTGRYRDTLRREHAGWRFVRRDFSSDR